MDQSRVTALKAIKSVFSENAKPKDTLSLLANDDLPQDRAFIMELLYGVIRYRDLLDWIIDRFLKTRESIRDDTINNIRMAIYQIVFMRVPDWAAVFEAVEIEKSIRGKPSLVNAVLRSFLRKKDFIDTNIIKDKIKRLAIETSHPEWLIKRWVERFGYKEARDMAMKNNERPPLTLRFKNQVDTQRAKDLLNKDNIKAHISRYCPNSLSIEETVTYGYLNSTLNQAFYIQDEASQMVAYLLELKPNMTVLDACAAPGGKTIQIAELMDDKGEVIAFELSDKRIRQLKDNIKMSGLQSVKVIRGDLLQPHRYLKPNYFDRILLDAPCSCLGVIRRNPDVKYKHSLKDLRQFQRRQLEMLLHLFKFLKPSGKMVYSVCSTEPEEGEDVIKAFLQKYGHSCKIEKSLLEKPNFREFYKQDKSGFGFYRTFPHIHNVDGFFATIIKKN
ncbi:MAG: 16S rRNA (cytosine(967)-C(5))-methyltransferase RsmB [Thermodesulfovibrionales bacterium]|nr:16S rRNA (cytosine(967)-C(5))-methyltransferase RsmB [Thermodesulfovibrionales bacterium]